jgi:hypothetical protein
MISGASAAVNDWVERLRNSSAESGDAADWLELAVAELRRGGKATEVATFLQLLDARLVPGAFTADPLVILTEILPRLDPCGDQIDPGTILPAERLAWVIAMDGKVLYDLIVTIFDNAVAVELSGAAKQNLIVELQNKTGPLAPTNPNDDPELVRLLGEMISYSTTARNAFFSAECTFYRINCGRIWVTVDADLLSPPPGVELASHLNNVLALEKTPCHGLVVIFYDSTNRPSVRKPTWLDSSPARPFRPGQSSRGWGRTVPQNGQPGISEAVHLPMQPSQHDTSTVQSYAHLSS